jgi:hypothetical protein
MRGRGGYIGFNRVPAATALSSAASGVWTLREAESLKRGGTWPVAFVNPSSIAGLQLWLDASDATTLFDATSGGSLVAADGGVARWEDKSGNARHATQGTSGNRPLRKTTVQGGKDVLRFDGSNDSLSIPSSTETFKFLHSADSTFFLVFRSGNTSNPLHSPYGIISTGTTASLSIGITLYHYDDVTNDTLDFFISRGVGSTWGVYSNNVNYLPSNSHAVISCVSRPGDALSQNRVAIRRNSGSLTTNNSPQGTETPSTSNSTHNLTVGSMANGENFLAGDICEVVIYNVALSDANRTLVENHLLAKWGIV